MDIQLNLAFFIDWVEVSANVGEEGGWKEVLLWGRFLEVGGLIFGKIRLIFCELLLEFEENLSEISGSF